MIERRSASAIAGCLAAALLCACSGANPGGVLPVSKPGFAQSAAARGGKGRVVLALRIPRAKRRHGHYVSPSTASVTFAVYDSTHTKLYRSVTANTAPGFNGCTPVVDGTFTCTFAAAAPAGIDAFDVTAFDNTNGQGAKLSLAVDHLIKVASGKANTLKMVLGGVPVAVDVGLVGSSPLAYHDQNTGLFTFAGSGAGAAQELQVIATDADQNIIVGPGAPTFGLQSNDTADLTIAAVAGQNGVFKLTPLHATTAAITLTAGATPLEGSSGSVFGHFTLQLSPLLYVANSGNKTITEYSSWSDSPIVTIPASAGLVNPWTMTLDASGNLYVANLTLAGSVMEFAPGSTTPSRTITGLEGPDIGLAVDASGDVFVTEAVGNVDVKEFTPSGGNTPSRTLSAATSPTGINVPAGIALDASGNLYVANNGGTIGVSVYAPGTSTTPVAVFDTGMNAPYSDAFDASGNLYVANYGGNNVTKYSPPFTNSTPVAATFSSAKTTQAESLALDSLGNLYVGTGTGNVQEFSAGGGIVRTFSGVASAVPSLAVDSANNFYLPSDTANVVAEFPPGSSLIATTNYSTGISTPAWVVSSP
jgi:hypothetical protein